MQAELNALIRLFTEAAGLVEKELLRSLARGSDFTARQKRERLTIINTILARLRLDAVGTEKAPGVAWTAIRSAYAEGSERALSDLRKVGERPVRQNLGGIHLDAIRRLYASLTDDLDQAILYAGKDADRTLRKAALHEVLVGQLAGRDRRGDATALEENLRSRGIQGFQDSRGRKWKLDRYARMSVATTAHAASTEATLLRLAENGIDLCRWIARPETGKQSPCDECQSYDGRIFSIGGITPGYPTLDEAPPVHPFCQCVIAPYIVGLSEAA